MATGASARGRTWPSGQAGGGAGIAPPVILRDDCCAEGPRLNLLEEAEMRPCDQKSKSNVSALLLRWRAMLTCARHSRTSRAASQLPHAPQILRARGQPSAQRRAFNFRSSSCAAFASRITSTSTRSSNSPVVTASFASSICPNSTTFSPRITYSPSGTSLNLRETWEARLRRGRADHAPRHDARAHLFPTITRSSACSSTMFANWSNERSVPMTLRPSRRTTSIRSARGARCFEPRPPSGPGPAAAHCQAPPPARPSP